MYFWIAKDINAQSYALTNVKVEMGQLKEEGGSILQTATF